MKEKNLAEARIKKIEDTVNELTENSPLAILVWFYTFQMNELLMPAKMSLV